MGKYEGDDPSLQELQEKADERDALGYAPPPEPAPALEEVVPDEAPDEAPEDDNEVAEVAGGDEE